MNSPVSIAQQGSISIVTIDNPPVNVFAQQVRHGLVEAFSDLRKSSQTQAVILCCSGKTFISGADLSEFDNTIAAPTYDAVLDCIETFHKPVVVALHGTSLGAGIELALACHYRIAALDAQLGMPEITLGVVPGAGGTQRLPRLIGARNALELLLSGKPINAVRAKELGLVDEVARGILLNEALAFATRLVDAAANPRRTRDLEVNDADPQTFAAALASSAQNMRGRSTPKLMIEAVRAASMPFAEGLIRETRISKESLQSQESKALRHLFFAERQTGKIPGLKSAANPRPIKSVGIVGSGTMGGGIAMCFADASLPVKIVDSDPAALAKGMARIEDHYRASIKRGRLREEDLAHRMALLQAADEYEALSEVDLIIEAVPEDMSLKQQVFTKLDRVARPGAVLATNTSTLDVNEIASATRRPEDVVGLHFFSPANVMRLLEIVRPAQAAPEAIATAFAVAKRIRKIGVLSGVGFGFIGNRMMYPYGREAERAVLEGATVAQVDGALEAFGMAMGMLAVRDLSGVDVGVLARKSQQARMAEDPTYYRCSAVLYEQGWLGQKTARGFYLYEGRDRKPHPEAEALFRAEAERLGIQPNPPSADEIQRRCLYALVNEGARILEDGIALRASDIDVVYTAGYGFPRHLGGPMFWADSVGLCNVVNGIKELAAKGDGQRWKPAPLLIDLARTNRRLSDWVAQA